ncbi:MAG: ATP-binding protein [Verrucomicrobiales bacterium]|nr:ATP-binding protein [Verrucomicrobiales bacterium]
MSLPGVFDPVDDPSFSERSRLRFLAEGRRKVLSSFKVLALFSCIVFPLFGILDYFEYPAFFSRFLNLRFICVGFMLITLFVCFKTRFGRRSFRAFTIIFPLIPAFFVSMMIYISGDPHTTYYIGMILCLNVIGFTCHWSFSEALISSTMVLLLYFVAITPPIFNGLDTRGKVLLLSNCFFAFSFGLTVALGALIQQRVCRDEFLSREKVRKQKIDLGAKNSELAKTMRELHQTEGELIQSEKMASMGQLSAGVIHEIGNPLNYSNQALFLLRKLLRDHNDDGNVKEVIGDIQDSFDRMKTIVTDLREFSHKSLETRMEFAVIDSVKVAMKMLGKEISDSGVNVQVELDPDLRIEAVKNQITQVFVNLIHNALQAICSNPPIGREAAIRIIGHQSGAFLEVSVIDNGPGIPQEIIKQLFDPFFTTKKAGDGTGLGLSICFRIIESHGGEIAVKSEPGVFTKFTMKIHSAQNRHHTLTNRQIEDNVSHEHAIS